MGDSCLYDIFDSWNYTEDTENSPMDAGDGDVRDFPLSVHCSVPLQSSFLHQSAQSA
jgi:hypothetical protein